MGVDRNNTIPYEYRVPTFTLFVNGREVERWAGGVSRDEVPARVAPYTRVDAVP